MTSLGMDERLERVLAYSLGWVSGLILFFLEKNRNVRRHAVQSMITLGSLSIVMFAISLLRGFLAWIPLLGWLTSAGLGLLLSVLWWVTIILWVWLIIMAFVKEDYHLPFVGEFVRYWV
ncbi:MAG: hypothetical protein E6I91_04995 [Chloroflexi bacterium]|nr:MAG: hypothetical protein E6I91_04995 [Chloroflexota bacterium]